MASLMEELVETLNREEQLYADLIPIQEDKLRAIVANDLAAIGRLSDEEQKLVDEVGVLETKRIRIANDIATVLGKPPGAMKLENMSCTIGCEGP